MVVVSLVTDALQLVCKLILLERGASGYMVHNGREYMLWPVGNIFIFPKSCTVVDAAAWTGRVALVVVPCMH
ncbi:hypothetical protein V6N11_064938 [Hibiscus sabdariffa]|uniref:Secreted protein n=1 Tax=Hibiscus sabdariffa TaxID=183260 RepID=A0ABR2SJF5_9ROSI